jgi:hypothetical protein
VNLLPPTPNTSQEAATSAATVLLEVPAPQSSTDLTNDRSIRRSRSRSPAPDPSQIRRSPRLASPAPGTKRPASEGLEEPPTKKAKEQ